MSDQARHSSEQEQRTWVDAHLSAIATRCNVTHPAPRRRLLGEVARRFVSLHTVEQLFEEFLIAVADGNYPEVIAELTNSLQMPSLDGSQSRLEIPDQWGRPSGIVWAVAEKSLSAVATLKEMPPEFKLSADFPEPIRYDAELKQIQYRGYMCKSSYDFLRSLHRGAGYQRALESLYRGSSHILLSKRNVRQRNGLFRRLLNKLGLWRLNSLLT